MNLRKKLYIIDGYALIYRSYFAMMNAPFKDPEGNNVSAVFGFFKTLMKLLRDYKPDYMVVAMDSKEPTFRHELYPEYKANREKAPQDLHSQVPVITRILQNTGIPSISKPGYEADDLIASLTREATAQGIDSVIFSGDKDLMQLVNGTVTALRPPKRGSSEYRVFTSVEVEQEFGVKPEKIVDYLSLIGDASDNVPGVDGIGPKTAVKLLNKYGSIENIYNHISELTPSRRKNLAAAESHMPLTRTLITLKYDGVKVEDFNTPAFMVDKIDYRKASGMFDALKLPSLARDALGFLGESAEVVKPKQKRGEYVTVPDMDTLKELLDSALKESEVLAFDTETDSLDAMQATLLGFSFTNREEKGWYFKVDDENREAALEVLRSYLPRFKVVGQNLKYDLKVLRNSGVSFTPWFDTQIAAWLCNAAGRVFGLSALANRYLDYKMISYEEAVGKKRFDQIPLEMQTAYCAEDSDITFRLYRLLDKELEKLSLQRLMREVEMPLVEVLAEMEMSGILLDGDAIQSLSEKFGSLVGQLEAKVFSLSGESFNLNSPKQLSEVLFDRMKLPPGPKTTQGYSTASGVLEKLRAEHPVADAVLEYRQINKLQNTYVKTLPGEVCEKTGRIHTHFLQTGTETGRLSCNNPNLQNIPVRSEEGRLIRKAFVPAPGCVFLSADYSQIDLVMLSHLSGDPLLRDAFINGEDIHRATASRIFNTFPAFVSPEQRTIAKRINFGVVYGISAHSISQDLGIPYREAKKFRDGYFETYKKVTDFISSTEKSAMECGYVETLLGHRRDIPEILSRNRTEQAKARRVAVNTVVQGSSADVVKIAMLKCDRAMKEAALESRMLLQIHDELIFEVPRSELEQMEKLVRDCMEHAIKISVPLRVSLETGDNWGVLH